jgi:hypothetical protein
MKTKSKLYTIVNEPFDDETLFELAADLNEYAIKAYDHFLKNNTFTEENDAAKQLFLLSLIQSSSKYINSTHEKK